MSSIFLNSSGGNHYADKPTGFEQLAYPYAIGCWFRHETNGVTQQLVALSETAVGTVIGLGLGATNVALHLFGSGGSDSVLSRTNSYLAGAMPAGTRLRWRFVFAQDLSATDHRIYSPDGKFSSRSTTNEASVLPTTMLRIGAHTSGTLRNFIGMMEALTIWRTNLSDAEIVAMANGMHPLNVRRGQIIASYINMGDSPTTQISDHVGGHHLTTITGTPLRSHDTPPLFYAPQKKYLFGSMGVSLVTLVVADLSHAHTLDQPALTQANALAVADLAHTHTLEAPALTQANVLALADLMHGHTVEAVVLTQQNLLSMSDLTHGHSLDNPALVQANVLAIADLLHAHSIDAIVLVQANALAVADLAHTHTLEAPVLTQANLLALADLMHAHSLDNIVLATGDILAVEDLEHLHSLDAIVLSQANVLAIAEMMHAHSLDAVVLSQANVLALAELLHTHGLDTVELLQANTLSVSDLLHPHLLDGPTLTLLAVFIEEAFKVNKDRALFSKSHEGGLIVVPNAGSHLRRVQ